MMSKLLRRVMLVVLGGIGISTVGPALADAPPSVEPATVAEARDALPLKATTPIEWCQTSVQWQADNPEMRGPGCPLEGACDDPAVRDPWIPGPTTPVVTLCLKFNIFANDDGSNPAATQADADAQLVQINADFAPRNIQFTAVTEFINDSTYRQFADSETNAMKTTYADSPATQLNVYVVNIQAGYLGVGTFPWQAVALQPRGGIIIDNNWFGAGEKTLTHEVGHCVGLWHSHHGVSEVGSCSACYERADGLNGDTTGDFASDTDPTPTNFNCGPPGGNDGCSATPWGPTNPENYMGYAPDACYTSFSGQQGGRMHCWINDVLSGWICGDVSGIPCGDIRRLRSRCTSNGTLKILVKMTNAGHAGEQVTVAIDGNPIVLTINGQRAQYQAAGAGGPHVITLEDPPGCVNAVNVSCP